MKERKKEVVTVQFKNRDGEGYGGTEYSYFAGVPLEVGQVVNCMTKFGEKQVRVARIGIDPDCIPEEIRAQLKTISSACVLLRADGEPCMYEPSQHQQERIDLVGAVENFFKPI